MTRRIGLWALIGLIVACSWVIVGMMVVPNYNLARSTWVAITAPASFLGRKMPLASYWFILLNSGAYALGLMAEGFAYGARMPRRSRRPTRA
jgi:hypothetical protein